MNFLMRLLLVPLAGMFILVARWAEQSYQKPPSAPLTQANRYCTAPASAPALAPAFINAHFIRFTPRAAAPVPAKSRPRRAARPPQAEVLPTY